MDDVKPILLNAKKGYKGRTCGVSVRSNFAWPQEGAGRHISGYDKQGEPGMQLLSGCILKYGSVSLFLCQRPFPRLDMVIQDAKFAEDKFLYPTAGGMVVFVCRPLNDKRKRQMPLRSLRLGG